MVTEWYRKQRDDCSACFSFLLGLGPQHMRCCHLCRGLLPSFKPPWTHSLPTSPEVSVPGGFKSCQVDHWDCHICYVTNYGLECGSLLSLFLFFTYFSYFFSFFFLMTKNYCWSWHTVFYSSKLISRSITLPFYKIRLIWRQEYGVQTVHSDACWLFANLLAKDLFNCFPSTVHEFEILRNFFSDMFTVWIFLFIWKRVILQI